MKNKHLLVVLRYDSIIYVVTIFLCASERGAGGEDRVPFDRHVKNNRETQSVVRVKREREVIQIRTCNPVPDIVQRHSC